MSVQSEISTISNACNLILANKKTRFICVIDKMGNLLYEKNQEGIEVFISDKKMRALFIQSVLGVLLEKDFDKQIGLLKYNISRRDKIDTITIPVHDHVILITVQPNENCDVIARNTIKIFDEIMRKTK